MPSESGQRPVSTSSLLMFEFGVIADDGEAEAEGDEPRREGRAQRGNELADARSVCLGQGGGLRRGGHAQTFSTSGRPRMPEGMKIKVMARIMKAATSL